MATHCPLRDRSGERGIGRWGDKEVVSTRVAETLELELPVANPADLLPRDSNNQWGSLNPAGSGDLQGQNLLSATFLTGIDTIGNTMKNANLQLRSEPPNPQLNVGPWNQSTFAPDLMRTPLELGAGAQ